MRIAETLLATLLALAASLIAEAAELPVTGTATNGLVPAGTLIREGEPPTTALAREHYRYSFGMMTSYRSVQGRFDPYGDYAASADGSSSWSIMSHLNFAWRLDPVWETSISVPLIRSRLVNPSGSATSYTIASPNFDLKYHWAKPEGFLGKALSEITLDAGVGLPLNYRSRSEEGNPSSDASVDDGGSGESLGPGVHAGIRLTQLLSPFLISVEGRVTRPFGSSMEQTDGPVPVSLSMQKGMRYDLGENVSYKLAAAWRVGLGFKQAWSEGSEVDGTPLIASASRRFSTSVSMSYLSSPSWRWSAGYETLFPFYSYLANQSYAPAISVGATYLGL